MLSQGIRNQTAINMLIKQFMFTIEAGPGELLLGNTSRHSVLEIESLYSFLMKTLNAGFPCVQPSLFHGFSRSRPGL